MPNPPDNIEKRVHKIELRADPNAASDTESRTVVGYAAVFNRNSEDMGFIEIIEPGAFADAIGVSDVRALFNHDPSLILARTASNTLRIQEDSIGLRYEFDLPATTVGNDLLISLRRGDVNQSSFAFSVKEQAWNSEKLDNGDVRYTRIIKKVERLYDVSPVTYPAYPDTTVAMRSKPATGDETTTPPTPPASDPLNERRHRFLDILQAQ